MRFEKFETEIWKRGYGIAAFNHYTVQKERHTYCVVLSRSCEKAFKGEGRRSEDAFDSIIKQINISESKC
jgi:hypothetical protein